MIDGAPAGHRERARSDVDEATSQHAGRSILYEGSGDLVVERAEAEVRTRSGSD